MATITVARPGRQQLAAIDAVATRHGETDPMACQLAAMLV